MDIYWLYPKKQIYKYFLDNLFNIVAIATPTDHSFKHPKFSSFAMPSH